MIDQLNEENKYLKQEVARLTAHEFQGNSTSRRTRSTDVTNTRGESSWSKLEISPVELGSMFYGDYAINIYGHASNKL